MLTSRLASATKSVLYVVFALATSCALAAPPTEPVKPPSTIAPITPSEQPASANVEPPKGLAPAADGASAEDRLAAYTEWLTIWTGVLACATAGLLIATYFAARDTRRMASAAERGNKLSRDMLVATNRPWISAQVALLALGSPLTSTPDGWQLSITYILKNVGHSPAAGADVGANLIPFVTGSWPEDSLKGRNIADMPTLGTTTQIELEKLCKHAMEANESRFGFGRTIFPGDELRGTYTIHGYPPLFERAKRLEPSYSGHFHLIFCVGYGSTFDEAPHVTAKAFTIYKRETGAGFQKINLDGETLRVDELVFEAVADSKTDFAT